MFLVSGPGVAGVLTYHALAGLPRSMLRGSTGTSGGSLALAALCSESFDTLLPVIDDIYNPSAVLDMVRLMGSEQRGERIEVWLAKVCETEKVTFRTWVSVSRISFSILAYNCDEQTPAIFSLETTPNLAIADALAAATAWPSVTGCHEIGYTTYCDVEYVLAPSLLKECMDPCVLVLVEGRMKSMEEVCKSRLNMDTWCSTFEFYGHFMDKLECSSSPRVRISGPHILDTLLQKGSSAMRAYVTEAEKASFLVVIQLVIAVRNILVIGASNLATQQTNPCGYT